MLSLLGQMRTSGEYEQTLDRLARTQLSQVLIFVAVLTVARLAIGPYLARVPAHKRGGGFVTLKIFNELLDAVIYAGVVVFMLVRPFAIQTFKIPTGSMIPTIREHEYIIANKAIYRLSNPKTGDIMVFRPPKHALSDPSQDMDYIKRLIGSPGETIEIRGGLLHRNGVRITEAYLNEPMMYLEGIGGYTPLEWKLVHYEGSYAPWKGQYIPVTVVDRGYMKVANLGTPTAARYSIQDAIDGLNPSNAQLMAELIAAPAAAIPPNHFLMMGDNRNNSSDGRVWGLITRSDLVGRSEVIWWPIPRWGKTQANMGVPMAAN